MSSSKIEGSRVTVIMPTYNRSHFLAESLNAILPQLQSGDELLVVNDGSTDDTLEVLAGYGDRIKVLSQENSGKSAALNRGLRQAGGDLVWIVDDDDIVADDARARLVAALSASPFAGFAYGRHDRFVDDEKTGKRVFIGTGYWFECPPEAFLCATLEDFFAHQPGMMVRKTVYDKSGPFCDLYSEDYDMLIRLSVISQPVLVQGILFHQRQHPGVRGSAAAPVNIQERDQAWMKSSQTIVQKHMAQLPLELFLPDRQLTGALKRRHALLQRGVIFGRHGLWQEAAQEFARAAEQSARPLSRREQELIQRISHSKFCRESFLCDPTVERAFRRIAQTNPVGRSLIRNVGRGLVWRARQACQQGRWAVAMSYIRQMFKMWVLAR